MDKPEIKIILLIYRKKISKLINCVFKCIYPIVSLYVIIYYIAGLTRGKIHRPSIVFKKVIFLYFCTSNFSVKNTQI